MYVHANETRSRDRSRVPGRTERTNEPSPDAEQRMRSLFRFHVYFYVIAEIQMSLHPSVKANTFTF